MNKEKVVKIASIVGSIVAVCGIMHIERTVGHYQCYNCGGYFVPDIKSYILSPHIFSKRYMECPICKTKSWCQKDYLV